jgi:putative membrane protein
MWWDPDRHESMMGWSGTWGGGWLVMLVLGIAVVAIAVAAIVALVRVTGHPSGPVVPATAVPGDAERMLAERYARGEIDDEEYQRRRSVLAAGRG